MTMIQLTVNIAMREEVTALLSDAGITAWQAVEPATGKTTVGQPRMNDAVWPGYNTLFFIPTDAETATDLLKRLSDFNDGLSNDDERLTAAAWPLSRTLGC